MSQVVRIADLKDHVGELVTLQGWLQNSRSSGKIGFLIVRDGTGLCQCVVNKADVPEEVFEQSRHLDQESSLVVSGLIRKEERAVGGYEMDLRSLEPVAPSPDYPITPKSHGVGFLMQHRHLWLRSTRQTVIMRIRHTIIDTLRRFFNDSGFFCVDTPILTPSAGEGTSTLFTADYFGDPVYLAQTGQLYVEAAAMALGKVYCFGPTFRAEKSKTRRHLTEFWMIEPEVAYAELPDLMELAEGMTCSVVDAVLGGHREDLEFLGRDVAPLEKIKPPFERLSYTEAAELLHSDKARQLLEDDKTAAESRIKELESERAECEQQQETARKAWQKEKAARRLQEIDDEVSELKVLLENLPEHMRLAREFAWGEDLGGSDETIISRLFDKPVFVHRYPKEAKAFYMKPDPDDPRVVLNFDMLAPEGYGEVIGGSQREDDYDALLERVDEEGYERENYAWYLDLRRYGSVPHGGFGLGLERTLTWMAGLKHVRETIAFPRMLGKIYP